MSLIKDFQGRVYDCIIYFHICPWVILLLFTTFIIPCEFPNMFLIRPQNLSNILCFKFYSCNLYIQPKGGCYNVYLFCECSNLD